MTAPAPLILVGTGRCGSTALHRLLARHPETAWPSGLLDRWPDRPGANRALLRAMRWPLVGRRLRHRFAPSECYRFWESLSPGFRRPPRDLGAADLTADARERIRTAFAAALPSGRVPVLKLTGWPRLGFLAGAFPEARFVHVLRDGRAVAASLLEVDFWRGREGPEGWRFGPLTEADRALWEGSGRSPVVLAGLQWKILTEALEASRHLVAPDRFLEIRYEALCSDAETAIGAILELAGLDWTPELRRALARQPFVSTDDKWRHRLPASDRERLEAAIREPLGRYGYTRHGCA